MRDTAPLVTDDEALDLASVEPAPAEPVFAEPLCLDLPVLADAGHSRWSSPSTHPSNRNAS